jgi:hypothetical protein
MNRLFLHFFSFLINAFPTTQQKRQSVNDGVSVSGNRLMLNGKPWTPKGANIEALNNPLYVDVSTISQTRSDYGWSGGAYWWYTASSTILDNAQREWGIDNIRFVLNQYLLSISYNALISLGVGQLRQLRMSIWMKL